ncbi:MAG: hybrid sensor histidine kinase/response regulator, partial [Bacteroidaceae bacterium]|nr:hybrid sensor histidine kinase/response regulator [Bacteroidaceae bacterium]
YMGYKLGSQNIIGEACVVSTCVDSKNRVWVGTDKDGLYCLDGAERRLLRHYKENFPATVMSVAEDNTGRIWIGSYAEGFGYIDTGGAYHKFPQYPNSSGFAIQASKNGDVWVATMGQGLLRITSSSVKAYTMQDDAPDNPGVNSIVNDYISKMSLSPDGKRVYLATTMGVCCLDIEKNSWVSTFGKNCLNYGTPCRVVKEYDGVLWVGANDGLFCYDFKQKKFLPYTADIGLSDNGIAAIERDRQGRLWIATDHGLCCHDPKKGTTRSYFVDNGLQSNEFSDGASSMTANGILVFGGVGGITWFWPEDIQQTNWDAKVSLVAFRVNNQPVNSASYSGSYQICDTTVIAAERFELASHDNTFAIQFSTLTYVNPEHITYLYSINGEDFTRLQPGTNEITLTHMPPGTYHFCVKAERNGIQTPERCFTVVIHAPWYRSIYAYIIYILALLAALWFYLKARRRKEQDRLRLQEHIHAEEMADAKLKFFMNISHEIRTPMTLIVAPLLSLMKQDDDPTRRSVYETIRRNAERILGLINQMMDLRKIDKGQMQMRMCETDLIGFVGDIHTLFGQQAKVKNIQFTYEHEVPQLPVWIDRGNFDKVIVNILSNAFKFTYAGGKVRIRVSTEDNTARIAIYDDGEPIPQDQLGRIFERFYQSPSSVNDRNTGTGIGLDLTRSLVELHHGTISVHNNDYGHGCEFVVTIPLGNQHLKPEEIAADGGESYHTNLLEDLSGSSVDNEEDQKQLDESHVTPGVRTSKRQRIVVVEDDE